MALIRWEPARELRSARTDLDRLFTGVFDTTTFAVPARAAGRRFVPALDVVETETEYVVSADLPGVSESDLSLQVADGALTLSGERRTQHSSSERGYRRIERTFGSFRRTLALPDGVEPAAVSASFDRGVLEIRIPKPAARQPHTIDINVGGGAPATEPEPATPAA